ncbi:MAG: nucleotidyl transferase AbiEii/AbiGii toxin family protein [Gammaproteobacteria bacterium]|nr:nucleotidyl transferase AbiEii/AbiGii toxin family protein [Gammaproteobacteria bacterium]
MGLQHGDRREVLEVAAGSSGRPAYLLEKDIWVVWAIQTLFGVPIGAPLVFKGGTSLSKAYRAIGRFSEDVDLTYDIRALAPDLVGDSPDALPTSRSQEQRWTREVRRRLAAWMHDEASPFLEKGLYAAGADGGIRVEDGELFIRYAPLSEGTGYVRPEVKLEFGARATGEPNTPMPIRCDAADYVPDVEFPTAVPRVMLVERTFWEKATAVHVYCLQGRLRSERFARHWYDLTRLDSTGLAQRALADRETANAVAAHKAIFFREKDASGNWIDYGAAVTGGLQLVPAGDSLTALADDYARMVEDRLLLEEAEPFDVLMDICRAIAEKANLLDC